MFYLGIDISKRTHVASIMNAEEYDYVFQQYAED